MTNGQIAAKWPASLQSQTCATAVRHCRSWAVRSKPTHSLSHGRLTVIQTLIDIDGYHSGKLTERTQPGESRDAAITRLLIEALDGADAVNTRRCKVATTKLAPSVTCLTSLSSLCCREQRKRDRATDNGGYGVVYP